MSKLRWPKMISFNGNLYQLAIVGLNRATYFSLFKDAEVKEITLDHDKAYLNGTAYLQGEEAEDFIKYGYCERCLRPAKEWVEAEMDGLGIALACDYDRKGNSVGFLCPECGFIQIQIAKEEKIYES